jgi:hypothetical protein
MSTTQSMYTKILHTTSQPIFHHTRNKSSSTGLSSTCLDLTTRALAVTSVPDSRDADSTGNSINTRNDDNNSTTTTQKGDTILRLEELIDGLQQNTSLSTLELSHNHLVDIDALLSVLWKCPTLQTLNLLGNKIAHLRSWSKFWSQPRPTRLRELEVSYNPFHYSYCNNNTHTRRISHQQGETTKPSTTSES